MNSSVSRGLSLLWAVAFVARSFQGRFLAIFFQDLGMSNTEVGYLLATSSLLGLLVVPLWAGLCDYLGGQRQVLLSTVPISGVIVAGYGLNGAKEAMGAFGWFMAVRVM